MEIDNQFISDMLYDVSIGVWVIELPTNSQPKLYCNDATLRLLGISENLSAEKLYTFWYDRIHLVYKECVDKAFCEMIKGKKQEVMFFWNHPQNSMIYIRLAGVLSEAKEDGTYYLKGYYKEITDIISYEQSISDELSIVDLYKSKQYVHKIIKSYDELFEIDIESMIISPVFYSKDKYSLSNGEVSVVDFVSEYIYNEDIDIFYSLFKKEKIDQMLNDEEICQVEIRKKSASDGYVWVCLNCFVEIVNARYKLVFYVYDIQKNKEIEISAREKDDIIRALVSVDSAIIEIDFLSNMVKLVYYDEKLACNIRNDKKYDEFIQKFTERVQPSDRKNMLEFITLDNLKRLAIEKRGAHIDLRVKINHINYEWVRFSAMILPNSYEKIFFLAKSIHKDYLLQHILEKFMYKSCDFIYYIDLKNDWYMRFVSNDKNTDLPTNEGYGYFNKVKKYIEKYAPKEEKEIVLECMKPEYIINHLDKYDYFGFTTGIIDDNGNYAHKHLQFQYFDKENRIVLLQRIDITENYMSTLEKKKEIERLSRDAMIDHLTNIYNRKGFEQEMQHYLDYCSNDAIAVFMLVDLDNFKTLNDELGHKIGDNALKDVARILKKSFRSTDIVGRLGGDEFVVLLKDIEFIDSMNETIEKLVKNLNLTYQKNDKEVKISASVGVSIFSEDGKTLDELYTCADEAMYSIKRENKNSYKVYNKTSD